MISFAKEEHTLPWRLKMLRSALSALPVSTVFHQDALTKLHPSNSLIPPTGTCERSTAQWRGGKRVQTAVAGAARGSRDVGAELHIEAHSLHSLMVSPRVRPSKSSVKTTLRFLRAMVGQVLATSLNESNPASSSPASTRAVSRSQTLDAPITGLLIAEYSQAESFKGRSFSSPAPSKL